MSASHGFSGSVVSLLPVMMTTIDMSQWSDMEVIVVWNFSLFDPRHDNEMNNTMAELTKRATWRYRQPKGISL